MGAEPFTIYEMSINYRIELQAHSLSNSGSSSVRLLPRRQLLADGTEVDAVSGNIAKYYHAELLAEYFEVMGLSLCPACAARDGRRVAALIGQPGYEKMGMEHILQECALCDAHGFLVTAKNQKTEDSDGEGQAEETQEGPVRKTRNTSKDKKTPVKLRQRLSKHSLIEYTFGLALPDHQAETSQLLPVQGKTRGLRCCSKDPPALGVTGCVSAINVWGWELTRINGRPSSPMKPKGSSGIGLSCLPSGIVF
jgi:CRISPR-associated negative auto-regulator DevR/Csa2